MEKLDGSSRMEVFSVYRRLDLVSSVTGITSRWEMTANRAHGMRALNEHSTKLTGIFLG